VAYGDSGQVASAAVLVLMVMVMIVTASTPPAVWCVKLSGGNGGNVRWAVMSGGR
jgi:hypothetical protein